MQLNPQPPMVRLYMFNLRKDVIFDIRIRMRFIDIDKFSLHKEFALLVHTINRNYQEHKYKVELLQLKIK